MGETRVKTKVRNCDVHNGIDFRTRLLCNIESTMKIYVWLEIELSARELAQHAKLSGGHSAKIKIKSKEALQ